MVGGVTRGGAWIRLWGRFSGLRTRIAQPPARLDILLLEAWKVGAHGVGLICLVDIQGHPQGEGAPPVQGQPVAVRPGLELLLVCVRVGLGPGSRCRCGGGLKQAKLEHRLGEHAGHLRGEQSW